MHGIAITHFCVARRQCVKIYILPHIMLRTKGTPERVSPVKQVCTYVFNVLNEIKRHNTEEYSNCTDKLFILGFTSVNWLQRWNWRIQTAWWFRKPTLFPFIKASGLNSVFHTVVHVAVAKCTKWNKLYWDKSQEKLYVLVRKQIRKRDQFDGFTTATAAYTKHTECP